MKKLEHQINTFYEKLDLDVAIKDLTEDTPSEKLYRIGQYLEGVEKANQDWGNFLDYLMGFGYLSDDDYHESVINFNKQKTL